MKNKSSLWKTAALSGLIIVLSTCRISPRITPSVESDEVREWVYYLASDEMKGRKNGSPEMKIAADWIAGQFRRYGLTPPPGQKDYFQEYQLSAGPEVNLQERNVIGYIKGSDSALRGEYIVISAHFDHLGIGKPVNGDSIYNGANDNASGTSALIGVAKILHGMKTKPGRSVVFVAFSGEEIRMQGSRFYCAHPLFPLEKTYLNINFELLGHCTVLGKNRYFISGPKYSDFDEKLEEYNHDHIWQIAQDVTSADRLFFYSDNRSFATAKNIEKINYGIPAHTFAIHNGEDHVHMPHDEAQFMDYENMAGFINYMAGVVLHFAQSKEKINWTDESFRHISEYRKIQK